LTTNHPVAYLNVDERGTPVSAEIEWPGPIDELATPELVGRSVDEHIGLHSASGESQIRDSEGNVISDIPLEIVIARFYEIPEIIIAKARESVPSGGNQIDLWKLLVMDYEGRIRYESDWTECEYQDTRVEFDSDIVLFTLRHCLREGEYVLDLSLGSVGRLGALPAGLRTYSPGAQSVVIRKRDQVRFYDIVDPSTPRELWSRRFDERVLNVAVSGRDGFVCLGLGQRRPTYEFIPVLSTEDGTPLAKLVPRNGAVLEGPFVFVGDFLLTSVDLAGPGGPVETKFVCVFDLSELRGPD
jgi:hypothetical protein